MSFLNYFKNHVWTKTFYFRRTGYVNTRVQTFVDKIRGPALLAVEPVGIPWRFAMIQAAHESRYGESLCATAANNLFGITADPDSSWAKAGRPIWIHETRECKKDGTPYIERRGFRKYDSWQSSLADWANLVQRRYPVAIAAARLGDFAAFAKGLESGGYATDRDKEGKLVYAKRLVDLHGELEGIA